jgi:O-antigen ligase
MYSGSQIPNIVPKSVGLAVVGEDGELHSSPPARATFAYAGLFLFSLVYFVQPGDWVPGAGALPLGKIAAVLALMSFAGSVLLRPGQLLHLPRQVTWVVLLWIQCALAVFFAYWRGGSFNQVSEFLKVVLMLIVMVVAANTLSRLRALIYLQVVSSLAIALTTLRDYSGGRAQGSVQRLGNSNDLALSLVVAIPLCAYLLLSSKRVMVKAVCALAILLMSYCVLITYSRGGFLAMTAAYTVMAVAFGIREKRRIFLVMPLLGVVFLAALSPSGYGKRLNSIFQQESDDGSRVQRQELFWRSIEITSQHPLFGVGPGNFVILSDEWRVTHNTYTELSAEAGIPALVLFLLVFIQTFMSLRKLRETRQASARLLAAGLKASIVGALVGSFFGSQAYGFTLYILVGYATCLQRFDLAPENPHKNGGGEMGAGHVSGREEAVVCCSGANLEGMEWRGAVSR